MVILLSGGAGAAWADRPGRFCWHIWVAGSWNSRGEAAAGRSFPQWKIETFPLSLADSSGGCYPARHGQLSIGKLYVGYRCYDAAESCALSLWSWTELPVLRYSGLSVCSAETTRGALPH